MDPNRLWVKRAGIGLFEVEPDAIALVDLRGRLIQGNGPLHRELPIHTAIYRRRPNVGAVVHTHPFHATALAASGMTLRLVSQDSLPFAHGYGRYDDPTLVTTDALGDAFAESIGDHSLALMRNHGLTAVGTSVEDALFTAVSVERSAALQLAAAPLGDVEQLGPNDVAELERQLPPSADRARSTFEYLRRRLGL